MGNDLVELRERIQFARDETKALKSEIEGWARTAFALRPTFTIDAGAPNTTSAGTAKIYAVQTAEVPTSIRAKAGVIANELRSILDGLACQLATRNSRSTRNVYFPISKSKAIFESDGVRKIKDLSKADQQTIVDLKPYREASPLLFGLHEADRTRKHTRLMGCAGAPGSIVLGNAIRLTDTSHTDFKSVIIDGFDASNLHIRGAPDLGSAPLGIPVLLATGVPVGMPFGWSPSVAYQEPQELAREEVITTLQRFADTVEAIVAKFE
ncbi:MAG: hypothetical protein JSR45_06815 [Proteobacteria bacterium]|nr:hypothetical protein [Pseudomonadota bacterium]